MSQPLPEVQSLLEQSYAGQQPDLTAPLQELRSICDAGILAVHHLVRDHGPLYAVRDLEAAGVSIRLYLPSPATDLPVHMHLHGGGWWMGSIATADPMARELAHVTGMAVISVGYGLAPERPYPASLDDVCAVLSWLAGRPDELGFTPTTLSLGGESAGANLTAAACIRMRDEGGPTLAAQWLDVPAVDLTAPQDESMTAFGTGFGLEMAQLPLLRSWYVGDDLLTDPYVSPAHAADLSGLPPAIVTTAEFDPLRDQGERYAAALEAAGNEVLLRRAEGHIHASSWLTALSLGTAAWYDETVAALVARHQSLEVAR